MKWLAVIAVLVAGLCTTAFNWHFSYRLGKTEDEALTLATFSVALDVTKWTMLIVAARAWPSLNSLAAILIWLTATSYSFTAALGFVSSNRSEQELATQRFREHHMAVAAAKQSPLWKSTHACTQTANKQTRSYCAALKELEAKEPIEPKQMQTTFIARLLKITETEADYLLSLYLALVCEIVSALGLFAVTASAKKERKPLWNIWKPLELRQPQITPPSSTNGGNSTPSSPNSGKPPSPNSSRGSWQRPRSWS